MRNIIVATLLLWAGAAVAEEQPCCRDNASNWYVGFTGEALLPNEVTMDESQTVFGPTSYDVHMGYGIAGVVGYQFFRNASVELEVAMRQWEVDTINGAAAAPAPPGKFNAQESKSIMVNHVWTDRSAGTAIMPYVGAGVGATFVKAGLVPTVAGETHFLKDTVFTYQLMAGLAYKIPNTDVELFSGYRYIGTQEGETSYGSRPGYKVNYDISSHNIDMGARLHF